VIVLLSAAIPRLFASERRNPRRFDKNPRRPIPQRAALAILLVSCIAPAHAMQCTPRTTQEQFDAAHLVFIGEVVHRELNSDDESIFGPTGTATLKILRLLKGEAREPVSIEMSGYSALHGSEGDVAAGKRTPTLVFARFDNNRFIDDFCSGSGRIRREDERLHALGFQLQDFDALGLPTDAALMVRLTAEWKAWRLAVLACQDAACYQRLHRDDRLEAPTVESYRREFERERKFYEWLSVPAGYRLIGGVVGPHSARLEYRLTQAYELPNELSYGGFVVTFKAIDADANDWRSTGARLSRSPGQLEAQDDERVWIAD
jgi:hypothetical protein